jgi:amidophosphoribosyltransferase
MLKEACGLFGVYGCDEAVEKTYLGLFSLQHRGQESAGIAALIGGRLEFHKGMGLVPEVFDPSILARLRARAAVGHVRYSTTGSSIEVNAQPLTANCGWAQIAIAHNGNLVNSRILRSRLEDAGSIFQTTVDSEILLHLIARPDRAQPEKVRNVVGRLLRGLPEIHGAYSLLFLTSSDQLIAARDPHGFRPLALGKLPGGAYAVASETCAFDLVGAEYMREVKPGELLVIDRRGLRSLQFAKESRVRPAHCVFEHVYFARPDSRIFGENVHLVRKAFGRALAREHPVQADLVTAIPDSGNSASLGYAEASGIPLEYAYVRNHYVGRTFIQPAPALRHKGVEIKLNPVADVIRGKRVIVIDDSIVRGNTARARVRGLRAAGAKEVHMRISCPPVCFPCHYGIDFPTSEELIAAQMSLSEIARFIGVDTLGYLSLDGMLQAVRNGPRSFCTACYSGTYPVPMEDAGDKLRLETSCGG